MAGPAPPCDTSHMQLLIANRRYSSWSLRGWLALKLSGLDGDVELLPLDTPAFAEAVAVGRLPSGRVPVLWDGEACIWETTAIIEWLAERSGDERFWPTEHGPRAFARSITAEMHGGFAALRQECPMDLRRTPAPIPLSPAARADVARIDRLWTHARKHFGGSGRFLFGRMGAADAMYAPVAARIHAYALEVGPEARAWVDAVLAHPWLREWVDAIGDEPDIVGHRL